MEINESAAEGAKVAALRGRLDTSTAASAEEKLLGMIGGGGAVVADLADVHYVSSAGLRVLLKAAKQAKAGGSAFGICSPQPPVREVLEISGFDKILSIYATRDEALAALK